MLRSRAFEYSAALPCLFRLSAVNIHVHGIAKKVDDRSLLLWMALEALSSNTSPSNLSLRAPTLHSFVVLEINIQQYDWLRYWCFSTCSTNGNNVLDVYEVTCSHKVIHVRVYADSCLDYWCRLLSRPRKLGRPSLAIRLKTPNGFNEEACIFLICRVGAYSNVTGMSFLVARWLSAT